MSVAERFAENLIRERRKAGLSQEDVAWRADIHRTEVSQLERALRTPRIDTLAKVAGALRIEPSVLLTGIRWAPGTQTPGEFTDPDASL